MKVFDVVVVTVELTAALLVGDLVVRLAYREVFEMVAKLAF